MNILQSENSEYTILVFWQSESIFQWKAMQYTLLFSFLFYIMFWYML